MRKQYLVLVFFVLLVAAVAIVFLGTRVDPCCKPVEPNATSQA